MYLFSWYRKRQIYCVSKFNYVSCASRVNCASHVIGFAVILFHTNNYYQ